VIYSILNEDHVPLKKLRADVPDELHEIVQHALQKNREQRFQSADAVVQALQKLSRAEISAASRAAGWGEFWQFLKQPRHALAALAVLLVLAAGVFLSYQNRFGIQQAKASLQEIEKLAKARQYFAAYDLAVQAEKHRKNDSTLVRLLGKSFLSTGNPKIKFNERLPASTQVPPDMVFVPGGKYRLVSWSAPTPEEALLEDFFIDRYEVTNAQFVQFIRGGG
jgi:formylglycine-generating enzyme required for sulfatase activity